MNFNALFLILWIRLHLVWVFLSILFFHIFMERYLFLKIHNFTNYTYLLLLPLHLTSIEIISFGFTRKRSNNVQKNKFSVTGIVCKISEIFF